MSEKIISKFVIVSFLALSQNVISMEPEDLFKFKDEEYSRFNSSENTEGANNKATHDYQSHTTRGDVDAQYYLGKKYESGVEGIKNIKQAHYYYELAAKQGHTDAQYRLGKIYAEGQYTLTSCLSSLMEISSSYISWIPNLQPGIIYDYKKAHNYFKLAADKGHVEAQYSVAAMYKNGQGVDKNIISAYKYYELAADQGHIGAKKSLIDMRYELGTIYKDGQGIPRNYKLAFEYLKPAADQGHIKAQHDLGYMYSQGKGIRKNLKSSRYYYKKAADQGHAAAQNNLGHIYKNGNGVPVDLERACYYYRLAEMRKYPGARNLLMYTLYDLGYQYEHGESCMVKNLELACKHYESAVKMGHLGAKINLERLNKKRGRSKA